MDILATLFPSAFPALALSHFVALLSPGPDFFLLVGYAIRYRLRGSVGLCIGIAAGNGLYIILAVIGWGILRHAPLLFTVIELLGAAYLLWIGSLLLRSRPTPLALDGASFGAQTTLSNGTNVIPFQARYFATGVATAGTANADATFKVQYE